MVHQRLFDSESVPCMKTPCIGIRLLPYKLSEYNCVSGKRVSQIANVPAACEYEKLDRVFAIRLRLQNTSFKCADVCAGIVDRDRNRLLLHRRRRTEDHTGADIGKIGRAH